MTTLTGTSLTLTDTLTDTSSLGLDGAYHSASAVIGGDTYIYNVGLDDDAIQVSTLSGDGQLTPVAMIKDSINTSLNGAFRLETFGVGGTDFLAVSGRFDDGVAVYSLPDSAPYLTFADVVFDSDSPALNLNGASDLETVSVSGGTFLYVAGLNDSGISVFSVDGAGGLSNVQNLDNGGTLELFAAAGLSGFQLNGQDFLLATGRFDDGVSVLSIDDNDGTLNEAASFDGEATGILNDANLADATVIDGTAYFYVPETLGDALTVLSFDGTTISEVQRITSPTALNGAHEAEVIALGDRLVLAVSARASDQLHLFEIDSAPLSPGQGGLTPLQTLTDGAGEGALVGATSAETVRIGETDYLLVTANVSDAVNVYEIGGGDDALEGTNGADDLSGGGGDDTLIGLAGGDDISGGAGVDRIEGGSGNDLLRGNGGSDWMHGGSGNDTMAGNNGEDTLRGSDGDDRMFGGNGTDTLAGNAGDDYLRGDDGEDSLYGGTGNDDMDGGAGNDMVHGGLGDDILRGGTGGDSLIGSGGADTLAGNDGDDDLEGGAGDDRLFGGLGNDTLRGDSGADDLRGDDGDDAMAGNDGADILRGGDGNDRMFGGADTDTLAGNDGDDLLDGGTGDDALVGGTGSDTLSGGGAADVFVFSNVAHSPHGADRDVIIDFAAGVDLIDLSDFGGLSFVASYSGSGNEVRYNESIGRLYVDLDGGASDFSVDLTGAPSLDAGDLIL